MVSINDMADRAPRALRDGETIDLGGGKRVRFIDTPHTPHGWDAGVLYEEPTQTLLCGDLFTQLGEGPALTDGDVVGPAIAAEDLFKYSCLNPNMGATIRGLASLAPRTLALMHGPSFSGDGGLHCVPWRMTTTAEFVIAGSPPTRSKPADRAHGRFLAQHGCAK